MKISILEPMFFQLTGHYADVALRLCEELKKRGHEVTVYSASHANSKTIAKFAEARVPLEPVFNRTRKSIRKLVGKKLTRLFDLQSIGRNFLNLPDADLYLWPTLDANCLIPKRFLTKPRLIIGGIWFDIPPIADVTGFVASRKLQPWYKSFILGIYEARLGKTIHQRFGEFQLHQLPVPYDGKPSDSEKPANFTVGLMGDLRPSRGRPVISALANQINAEGWDYNFHGNKNQLLTGRKGVFINEFVEDLGALIRTCDVIFWPSNREDYLTHTSGITYQCIANGVPIITPQDCLPSSILDDYDLDYPRFSELSPVSIMSAGKQLAANYPYYKNKALLAAEKWKATQGTEKFVTAILDLAKSRMKKKDNEI